MAQNILTRIESVPVQVTIKQSTRLYFVDHLRTVLLIFIVLHHIAMVYGASAPFYRHCVARSVSQFEFFSQTGASISR